MKTKLPEWRLDNKWAWLGSLLISVVVTTTTVILAGTRIYYDAVGDIREIKKDVKYVAEWTVDHDRDTDIRIGNFQELKNRVVAIETRLKIADDSASIK